MEKPRLPFEVEAPPDVTAAALGLLSGLYEIAGRKWPAGEPQVKAVSWLLIDLYEHAWALTAAVLAGRNSAALSLVRLVQERWECLLAAHADRRFANRYLRAVEEGEDDGKVRARPEDARDIIAKAQGLPPDERKLLLQSGAARAAAFANSYVHPSSVGPGGSILIAIKPDSMYANLHYVMVLMVLSEALIHALTAERSHPEGCPDRPNQRHAIESAAALAIALIDSIADAELAPARKAEFIGAWQVLVARARNAVP